VLVPDVRKEYRHVNCALASLFLILAVTPLVANIFEGEGPSGTGFLLPRCTVLEHTGKACGGCGLTRSVLALYHGDLAASRAWHPAGALVVALVFAQLLFRLLYLADQSAWLPWIDFGQLILSGILVKFLGLLQWGSPSS